MQDFKNHFYYVLFCSKHTSESSANLWPSYSIRHYLVLYESLRIFFKLYFDPSSLYWRYFWGRNDHEVEFHLFPTVTAGTKDLQLNLKSNPWWWLYSLHSQRLDFVKDHIEIPTLDPTCHEPENISMGEKMPHSSCQKLKPPSVIHFIMYQ